VRESKDVDLCVTHRKYRARRGKWKGIMDLLRVEILDVKAEPPPAGIFLLEFQDV
jgi:hypothetical protein